ncbi:conserved hypothetical protein [Pediculus humanus corporis]|uniref:SOSS complex subunit A homolog n=1 Tax=Pediculus humanus subsp. corporis TaxID=121224 RepID=E0VJF0_PEDHC|nr:uncharacterized protein Phum_PHUM244110 [Pediculus humanus corporis]EEB13506.1 conserved hypothetical protein [Pediculus humanus corporis]
MDQVKISTSRLFCNSIVENKDEFEEKYERSYQSLQSLTAGLSDKETHDALTRAIVKDKGHEEMSLGLLAYRDLTLISRDGLTLVVSHLSQLVLERYLKFNDVTRTQLMWLLREMIRNGVNNVDTLCWNVLRHAAGGDISPRNIFLVENLLDIFLENRAWLDKYPVLLSSVVYSFLRLIEDHCIPQLQALRQKEVTFVVTLVRERFAECLSIGRDFLRLLQIVARIPEFEQLWKDILLNPKILSPNFTGVQQLMQQRTSRRYLQSRLTPEMEKKLVFFTGNVRFGAHKRYQDWFLKQYLMTTESQSLRIDLIRFIVGVIHPPNELLCSDIIPRWAVIGWLLTTCTSAVAAANAKLALFYDWLFFDPERDNIMNIEPAILVMSNSMRSHPAVTATLLDFMCRVKQVKLGMHASLKQIVKMRVLSSLVPLFDSPKLDRDLRNKVRATFKEIEEAPAIIRDEAISEAPNNHTDILEPEPAFSDDDESHGNNDDEDDIPLAKVRLREKPGVDTRELLDPEMVNVIDELSAGADNEAKCEAMEKLVQLILDEEDLDSQVVSQLAYALSVALQRQFEDPVFPSKVNDESLEDSIGRPLFVLFRNISQLPESDRRRQPLLMILAELKSIQPRLGYLFLYFLLVCKLNKENGSVYQNFCQTLEKSLEVCLLEDLSLCQEDDDRLLFWLVQGIYEKFSSTATNNPSIIHLIVSTIDSLQLQELIFSILLGRLLMFTEEKFSLLIKESLTWESWEQVCLWQLVTAHGIPLPTAEIMKHLLSRTISSPQDKFVVSILKYWAAEHEDKFAELVGSLLNSRYPGTSPNKRKRGAKSNLNSSGPPTADQVHLDHLRQCCEIADLHVYSLEPIQRALQVAQLNGNDTQKQNYSDLFALAETEEKNQKTSGRGGQKVGKSRSSKPKASLKEISDSSENSSDEEEIVKPKQPKKRKKLIGSDSD